MNKIVQMARYEYWRHVRRRSFLWTALGVPLLMFAGFGLIYLVASRSPLERQLGMVDQAQVTNNIQVDHLNVSRRIPITRYPNEAAARQALDSGVIDAYVVIPQDYMETGNVRAVAPKRLTGSAESQIRAMLRAGLLSRTPEATRTRLLDPADLVLRTMDGGREIGATNGLLFLLPYAFAVLFVMTTFTTSGYLLQAIAEEKEGRVMELLATTVSAEQMMAGKIIGLSAVGLTQMLAWVVIITAGLLIAIGDVSWLEGVQLPWSMLGWSFGYFLLGYFLFAACYTMLGAAVTSPQEAQPLATPLSLLASLPLFLLLPILSQPNGTLAVILSLVPFSAPMTMLMRLPLAEIPTWELITSLLILAASVIGTMWLAARVMRRGMLRYGKRLSLREIFA